MIDVLHVPYTYFPDATGGTETYVAALARGLSLHGVRSAVAAPSAGAAAATYEHAGVPVHRFPGSGTRLPLEDLYGAGDPTAAESFAAILRTVRPRIVHLHGWTSGISLRLLRVARDHGTRVAFTYHTPSVSCARGSLMIYGREVCDGALFVDRCSRCLLQQRGVPLVIGSALAMLPPAVGRSLRRLGVGGGPLLALRMTELIEARHEAFRGLVAEADALVAVQDWVYDLLLFLGVPAEKLRLSRLALPEIPAATVGTVPPPRPREPGAPLRLAFFGRVDASKGVHMVVRAMARVRDLPMRLDIFGAPQGREGAEYLQSLQRTAEGDDRIRFLPAVPATDVRARMAEYDALVVPSIWMETGPLVIPEAMSVGVPVIGSNRGGITRFIHDGVDGLLVAPGDEQAWASAMRRLATEQGLLARLRAGIRPPETMARIVGEMLEVYATLSSVPVGA
ncbi:MAG TPA: glycosyltransferase [Gemmatimonadaceae bacterium]|nr:glycosyltransferase [Gemmatimonadaceae bacterium]